MQEAAVGNRLLLVREISWDAPRATQQIVLLPARRLK